MRKKQIVAFLLIFSFLSVAGMIQIGTASAKLSDAPIGFEPLRIGDRIRNANYGINLAEPEESDEEEVTVEPDHEVIDEKIWLLLDDYYGGYYLAWYELWDVSYSDNTEVWIQTNRAWPDPDPHDPDRAYPEITAAQVQTLLLEFDSNIYPTDTDYFGTPDSHDGSNAVLDDMVGLPGDYYFDENGRDVILVSNIRDDNYYTDYPYYIAGFYSPSYEYYFDRNIISIDSYQWEERVGPDGSRPYLYEGVIAHEYQHLIHDDYNGADETFMNEGCSMFAEYLCGYGVAWGDINSYMATPDNSLTVWGDQGGINILADYGVALLWSLYLIDRFGPEFLGDFVQDGIPGITGLELLMAPYTFNQVYHDWRIANLIHSDWPGHGRYNYDTIDLGGEDADPIRVYEVTGNFPQQFFGTSFGTTITILGYDTGVAELGPFGSDYIALNDLKKLNLLLFDGDDTSFTPGWELVDGVWYSGDTDLLNALIVGEAYVDPEDPTLNLTTYWDIEDYWDFGFIQVSTDDGETWTSLENEYTTWDYDPSAHPDVIANLPGLTSWSGFLIDPWYEYISMTFDLTEYAGQDVLIGLRYVTDWAFTYEGWFVEDNVQVSGVKVELGRFYPFPEADFMVTLIEMRTLSNGKIKYKIKDMYIWDEYEIGVNLVHLSSREDLILIISPIMPEGIVDYSIMVRRFGHKGFCR